MTDELWQYEWTKTQAQQQHQQMQGMLQQFYTQAQPLNTHVPNDSHKLILLVEEDL